MPSAPLPLLTERWLSAALDISVDLERHRWQPSRQIPIDANVWNSDSSRGREGGNGLTLLCAMLISKTHSGCFRKFLLGLWCFKHCVKLLNYLLRANHFHPPNYSVQKKKNTCCLSDALADSDENISVSFHFAKILFFRFLIVDRGQKLWVSKRRSRPLLQILWWNRFWRVFSAQFALPLLKAGQF